MAGLENATPILVEALDAFRPGWREMAPRELCTWANGLAWKRIAKLRLAVARRTFGRPFQRGRVLESFLDAGGDPVLSDLRKNEMNLAFLPLLGIGPDSFQVNEHLPDDMDVATMGTLRRWDEGQHAANQEAFAKPSHGARAPRPYVGWMSSEWVRWIEGGEIAYGFLGCAAAAFSRDLWDEAWRMASKEIFPFEMVEGPENGLPGGSSGKVKTFRWDFRPVPRERYELARLLMDWIGTEVARRHDGTWGPEAEAHGPWAHVEDVSEPHETKFDVTFSGPSALGLVRPESFLSDLRALPGKPDGWDARLLRERERFMSDMLVEADRIRAAAGAQNDSVSPAPSSSASA